MTSYLLDLLSVIVILSSVLVITAASPVSQIVYLITVFTLAGAYLIVLGVGFIGLSYLVVYVGAVAVLFLFVVMMLRLNDVMTTGSEYTRSLPIGFIVGLVFVFELLSVVPIDRLGEVAMDTFNTFNGYLLGINFNAYTTTTSYALSIPTSDTAFGLTQVQTLGYSLYGYGTLWLLITSIILIVAILGPITLCIRFRL